MKKKPIHFFLSAFIQYSVLPTRKKFWQQYYFIPTCFRSRSIGTSVHGQKLVILLISWLEIQLAKKVYSEYSGYHYPAFYPTIKIDLES